ncbi:hypothetical protein VYU27_005611 [Nannochloropsis oceanica]
MLAAASPLLLLQRRTIVLTFRANGSGYKITSTRVLCPIKSTRAYSASRSGPTRYSTSCCGSSSPLSASFPSCAPRLPLYPLTTTEGRRSLSTAPSSTNPIKGQEDDGGVLIYEGGHRDVIRTLKRVSLTTCIIGLFSTPFFLTLGSEAVPLAANISLTSIVLLATCGPTILLHAFTKPYIFALRLLPPPSLPPPQDDSIPPATTRRHTDRTPDIYFSADTINWLSRRVTTTFKLSDVKPLPRSTRPFVSFSARDRLYFVHGETFPDKDLLEKLLGRPLKKSEMENGGEMNR